MTATDEQYGQLDTGYPHTLRPELHRALMARGIDYWVADGITFWNRDDGCECLAYGYKADGVPKLAIKVVGFTDPEQAIAATLGSGTCHNVHEPPKDTTFWPAPHFKCSECGATHISMNYVFYCPNCGRRIVEVDE